MRGALSGCMLSPAPGGQDLLDPTMPEQPLLPHGTTAAWVLASWTVRIAVAGATQIPDLVLQGLLRADPKQGTTSTVAAWQAAPLPSFSTGKLSVRDHLGAAQHS